MDYSTHFPLCVNENNYLQGSNQTIGAFLDSILDGYDKLTRPNWNSAPVTVGVSMYILSVHSISESNMVGTYSHYLIKCTV